MFRLLKALLPLALFGLSYKFIGKIPTGWWGKLDLTLLDRWEKTLCFGFSPPYFFQNHHGPFFDLLAALFYSLHFWVFLFFTFYLWIRKSPVLVRYTWAFLLTNLAWIATAVLIPTAPPWYLLAYGAVEPTSLFITGSAAGLLRADQLFGIHFFERLYAQSGIVFGAFPSMHAAWPVLIFTYARKARLAKVSGLVGIYLVGVWAAAVYLGHHYFVDLLGGALYTLVGYLAVEKVWLKTAQRTGQVKEFVPEVLALRRNEP